MVWIEAERFLEPEQCVLQIEEGAMNCILFSSQAAHFGLLLSGNVIEGSVRMPLSLADSLCDHYHGITYTFCN